MTSPTNTPLADKAREIAIAISKSDNVKFHPQHATLTVLGLMAEAVELAAKHKPALDINPARSKIKSPRNWFNLGAERLRAEQRLLAERLRNGEL